MQSLPDLYPIFIQQNVRFLDRTASSERSFMWQRRLAGKLLRVSLRTQDRNVAQYRAVKLTEAFIRLSQLMGAAESKMNIIRDKTLDLYRLRNSTNLGG